jgi:hypothetical protein
MFKLLESCVNSVVNLIPRTLASKIVLWYRASTFMQAWIRSNVSYIILYKQ